MNDNLAEWLTRWFKEKGVHRTLNDGQTLACPAKSLIIDIASPRLILFCPLCGKKLGKLTEEKETRNYIWNK